MGVCGARPEFPPYPLVDYLSGCVCPTVLEPDLELGNQKRKHRFGPCVPENGLNLPTVYLFSACKFPK